MGATVTVYVPATGPVIDCQEILVVSALSLIAYVLVPQIVGTALVVAILSTASAKVKVPVLPLTTVKAAETDGAVIVAVLQGSRTIMSKVTELVALLIPPSELLIVFVKVTVHVNTFDLRRLMISIRAGLPALTVIGAPAGIVQA